jgi:hypothetical protein
MGPSDKHDPMMQGPTAQQRWAHIGTQLLGPSVKAQVYWVWVSCADPMIVSLVAQQRRAQLQA